MCLAIPMQLKAVKGEIGLVEMGGLEREIHLDLIDSPQVGDYLIVHAGFAIEKLDREEAEKTLSMIAEIQEKGESA